MRAIDLFPAGHPIRETMDEALTVGGLVSHRRHFQEVWAAIADSASISDHLVRYLIASNEWRETAGRIPQRMAAGLGAP